MSSVSDSELNRRRLPTGRAILAGIALVVITGWLYWVALRSDTNWHWLPAIAMGYLWPVGLAAFCCGLQGSLAAALIEMTAIAPLVWLGWQRQPVGIPVALGVIALASCGLAYTFGVLSTRHRRQTTRYNQAAAELERRLTELAAVQEIDRAMGATLDPQPILDLVLERAVQYAGVTAGVIGAWTDDDIHLEIRADLGLDSTQKEALRTAPRSSRQGLARRATNAGRTIWVADANADDRPLIPETRAELAIPLKTGDRVIGVLDLGSAQTRTFDAPTIAFVEHLAGHAATALERARLHAISEMCAQETRQLYDIATLISSTLDLDELLNEIITRSATFLGATRGILLLLDPFIQTLIPHPAGVYGDDPAPVQIRIPLDEQIKSGALYQGHPFTSIDARRDPRIPEAYSALVSALEITTLLSVPLRLGDQYVGEIHLCNKQKGVFTQDDLRLMSTIASHFTTAIVNAQIYRLTDLQLRDRIDELTAMQHISRELYATLRLDKVLDVVIEEAFGITGATCGYIALAQEKGDTFEPIAWRGYEQQEQDRLRSLWQACGDSVTNMVIQTGQSKIMTQVTKQQPPLCAITQAQSALLVPIFYDHKVVGLVHLLSDQPNTFTPEHKQFVESLAFQATLAIRNARLYEAEVEQRKRYTRRAEQIAQLASIGAAFRLEKTLLEVMQLTAQAISKGMGFKAVMISVVQGEPPVLDRIAAVGVPQAAFEEMKRIQHPLSLIQGVMRDEFRIDQSYYIPHQHKAIWQDKLDTYIFTDTASENGRDQDLILVPMYGIGQKILGIVTVAQPIDERVPDRATVETLQVFAQQAATAVENHWLYQDLQRRIDNLMLINQVGQTITSGLDQAQVLQEIVSASAQLLNCEYSILFFWERDSQRLVPQVAHGFSMQDSQSLDQAEFNELCALVIKGGNSFIVSDVTTKPQFDNIYAQSLNLRSMLTVPLIEGKAVSGALLAGSTRVGAFDKTDQVLLSTLADQASVAIQNARLYSSTVLRATQLEMLNEIGKTIISSLDMSTTLSLIMAQVGEAFNAEAGTLLLMKDDYLEFSVAFGPTSEQIKGLTLELGQGIAGWVAQTGQSALVSDAKSDTRHFGGVDQELEYQTQSLICTPLKGPQDRIIGVLEILNPMDREAFNQHDLELLESLATFAVIAIENANLFAQRERQIVELSILNETGQALGATLQQNDLLQLIYHQVTRVMDAQNFFIALYDPEQDLVSFPIVYEHGVQLAGPEHTIVNPEWQPRKGRKGLTEYIIESGHVLWFPDRVPERVQELGLEQIGVVARSWLGVPILSAERTLGVIAVQSYTQENAYDEEHRDLLKTIAGHASVAIQNARLFDQITMMTENLESLVEERTKALGLANKDLLVQRDRLNTLYQITRELSSSLDPDRVLNRTLALINYVFGAHLGYILLRDAAIEGLVYKAVIGTQKPASPGHDKPWPRSGQIIPPQARQGIVNWAMGHRNSIRIGDLTQDERWHPTGDLIDGYRSILTKRIVSGDEAVGAIVLCHCQKDYFTIEHQEMLDAVTSQIGIMVSNAEMFRLLREATGRLGKMLLVQQLEAAKSQAILEGVADGVMVMDARGQVSLFNLAAERIFQTSRKHVIGRQASDMPGFYALAGTSWTELAETWGRQGLTERQVTENQVTYEERFEVDDRVVSMRVAPVIRQDVFEGIVAVFRDITQDVQVERIKSEFVSMVSHELRTPMTSIKGYIDLLYKEMVGPVSEPQKRFLQIVKENADRLTSLVNDLLDISRIDTGRVSLSIEAKDPLVIVDNVLRDLRPNARERHQTLYNEIKEALPLVRVDPARMTQILTNLVSNAIKYTPTGGWVKVTAQVQGEMVHIHVTDNGIGISKEDQEKLFSRFFRADDELVRASNGTGLGLSIAKSFTELHGGQLWFTSELGKGTTFSFSLPVAQQTESIAAPREFKTISYSAQDKHILVIEDEVDIANLISHQLRSQGGYRVHISRSGHNAIAYLADKDHHVDLITLDLRLPDMDGFKVLEKIKNDPSLRDIPVVIASILHREEQGRKYGACAYIPKPIQQGELLTTIERILTNKDPVLVVEDDRSLAGMLQDALEKYGYTVIVEYNGRNAVETAKNEHPGLILLDIKMPGMDGYQVLSQLKKMPETSEIPVIMVTGSVSDAEKKRRRVLEMGAAQFLTKPLSIEDLVLEMKKAIN